MMREPLRRAFVRPAVQAWLASSTASWRTLPTPSGKPTVVVAGPDPDRLLLVGSGIAVGYGAKSHDLALAGQLARLVSESTGRGTRVDVVVTEEMTGHDVRELLNRRWLSSVDAVIATPGGLETLLLHRPRAWRRQIESLLDHIRDHAPASLHIFIIGLPPLPTIVPMPALLGFLANHSARQINSELIKVCASRKHTTFVPFVPTEVAGRTGTGRTYRQWAELIAPAVSAGLEPHVPPARG
jgi:hypothetical protein